MPLPVEPQTRQPGLMIYGVLILIACCLPALLAMSLIG